MNSKLRFIFIVFFCLQFLPTHSQENTFNTNTRAGKKHYWSAHWVNHPSASPFDYGVFHFRNCFTLKTAPEKFIIHISADNRYKLFINGKWVCLGPARGDIMNWRYESVDIAPYITSGKNCIAVEVVNFGQYIPEALISERTGLILQAEEEKFSFINTGSGNWKVTQNIAYAPLSYRHKPGGLYATGPGDNVEGKLYPWGWETAGYDDTAWGKPQKAGIGHGRGVMWGNPWHLVKRSISLLEQKQERFERVRKSSEIKNIDEFIQGGAQITILPNSDVTFLLDLSHLTIGFPELIASKGKGSRIEMKYAESLYSEVKNNDAKIEYIKGNRNDIENKIILGIKDVFFPDGGENRLFRPLFFRTFRYVQLHIRTEGEALVLQDYYNIFTAYPLQKSATFETNRPELSKIIDVGWHTQRLCAGETFYDCPYYEQMNYAGDSRIQALVCCAMGNNNDFIKDGIQLFHESRLANGLTQARAPTNHPLVIVGYSLYHISMIYDYFMYRNDTAWIKKQLPGIQYTLDWFQHKTDNKKGLLKALDWWNYTDWTDQWYGGIPIGADDNYSAIINLHFLYTLQQAAEIYAFFGKDYQANEWEKLASGLKSRIQDTFYDDSKEMYADTPDKNAFSQHTNIFAILTGTCTQEQAGKLMEKVLHDTSLVQCSFYYNFYLFAALKKSGMSHLYLDLLKPWNEMIDNGLTTFAEKPGKTRSDCHAWSTCPLYYFMDITCGIEPAGPGFNSIKIQPEFGGLKQIKASFPHPYGEIKLDLKKTSKGGAKGTITIPENAKATFIWYNNNPLQLHSGLNEIN